MEKLKFKNLLLSENVIYSIEGRLTLINIINRIYAKKFPAVLPQLAVIYEFEGKKDDYGCTIKIKQGEREVDRVVGKLSINDPRSGYISGIFSNIEIKDSNSLLFEIEFTDAEIENSHEMKNELIVSGI